MHRDQWRADFSLSLGIAENPPCDQPVRHLNLIMTIFKIRQPNFGIARQAQKMSGIELHFGAATGRNRNLVA